MEEKKRKTTREVYYVAVTGTRWKTNISVGGVIEIQTERLPVAVALKFTVHGVQSFIKGHRKSGVHDFNEAF